MMRDVDDRSGRARPLTPGPGIPRALPANRSRPRSAAALASMALAVSAVALAQPGCGESKSAQTASGNDVIDDTREQPRPPANPDPPSDGAIPDAPYADADYAPLGACAGCTCSPDTHYCFGGGAPKKLNLDPAPDAEADADAGPAACPVPADAGATQVGCNAIPPECAATPTCECLLNALQPRYKCYLVCHEPGAQLLLYCPTP